MPAQAFTRRLLFYTFYKTVEGYGGLVCTKRGLVRLFLPLPSRTKTKEIILREFPNSVYNENMLKALKAALAKYFGGQPRCPSGQRVTFKVSLDLSSCTDFQRKVYFALKKIPYGEICSYKGIAHSLNKPSASRAVGSALKSNPIPVLIPCHRVIKSDGSLGGFNSGVAWKKKLLALERVKIKENRRQY